MTITSLASRYPMAQTDSYHSFCPKVVGSGRSGTIEAVNLTRTTKGRIGLLLREGEDDGGIYVEDVVPGEPAATQGNLRTGDRIVEVRLTNPANCIVHVCRSVVIWPYSPWALIFVVIFSFLFFWGRWGGGGGGGGSRKALNPSTLKLAKYILPKSWELVV